MKYAVPAAAARRAPRELATVARRSAFLALLCALPLLAPVSSSAFEFPGVSHCWSLAPFAALMMLGALEAGQPRAVLLELIALLAPLLALACERPPRAWPVLLVYPAFAWLGLRMFDRSRPPLKIEPGSSTRASTSLGPAAELTASARGARAPALPRAWLVAGLIVLAAVHISWTMQSRAATDVGEGGVRGAQRLLGGHPLYSPQRTLGGDQHTDTYGPANYEAYIPLAELAPVKSAARLTALFFDLLTALLLFILGRRIAGADRGVLLAFCWLAFPFGIYEDALGLNDTILAAALVLTLLAAGSPLRRGAAAALAAWVKLSPLALLPLLARYETPGGRRRPGTALSFLGAFLAVSLLVFAPVLPHDGLGTFLARTVGFQAGRAPSETIWSALQVTYAQHAPWLATLARIGHGALVALAGALLGLLAVRGVRGGVVSLAAASAAIVIVVEACLGYWAYGYILWFAPLVLVAGLGATAGASQSRPYAETLTGPGACAPA